MSLISIVSQERLNFLQTAHCAVVFGMRDAWKRCQGLGNIPQEPDFVASLVLESGPLVYQAFEKIFRRYGIEFSLTSVYCHQTPKVKYDWITKTSCELGDLLLVHVHREGNGQIRRNAILYQAKVTSKQPYKVSKGECDQLTLYTDWPQFEYHRSPPISGQRRLVQPHSPHRGAQYMLIDDSSPVNAASGLLGYPGTYPIGSCIADAILQDHNDLASELVDFLVYRSGRAFGERPINNTDIGWTQTVWDLLDISLKKVIKRKNSGHSTNPRIAGGEISLSNGLCFAMRTSERASKVMSGILGQDDADWLFSRGEDLQGENVNQEFDDDEAGISLILIETSEAEE